MIEFYTTANRALLPCPDGELTLRKCRIMDYNSALIMRGGDMREKQSTVLRRLLKQGKTLVA